MSKIMLIGPGAIGGLVATWLCQEPAHEVSLAVRTPFSRLELETPQGQIEASPRILTRPEEAHHADWVLLATKAYDSSAVAEWLPAVMSDRTQVAVLQNGVDHVERISEWVPRERILPVIVDCPTERVAPGKVRQRGDVLLRTPVTPSAESFTALFAHTDFDCRQTEDFLDIAWWKLCINAAGVVNALTLKPAGVTNDPSAARLMRLIVEETAAVGRAEGARLADDIADEVVEMYRGQPADAVNSLLADRLAGRPMEIDLRNGVIVERGARHGIPTPCNDMAVTLLKVN
jgi:2-dehydropantoate 2-reductase